MKFSVTLIFAIAVSCWFSCDDKQDDITPVCGTRAIVRDLSGLDGCGFVFELEDGTRLEPIIVFYCGTLPVSPELANDPIHSFQFVDGKSVKINYEINTDFSTACMAGTPVKITCISEERSNNL